MSTTRQTLYLVGCGAQKCAANAPARDLYTGPLFRRSFRLAEHLAGTDGAHAHLFILSALHGVISPDDVIAPYDCALSDLPVARRRSWGLSAAEFLHVYLRDIRTLGKARIVIYAGAAYADAIRYGVATHARVAPRIETPLEGLTMGRRLSRLNSELDRRGLSVHTLQA